MKLMRLYALAGAALVCGSMHAATVTKLNDDVLAPLRGTVVLRQIHLTNVPLDAHGTSSIELEEFEVWAPGAKVIIHGDNGVVMQKLDPPPMRFFRGLVNGDPESFAFFSMEPSGRNIQGLVVTRDKKFAVNTQRRPGQTPRRINRPADESATTDTFLTAFDDTDGLAGPDQTWQCEVDKMTVHVPAGRLHATGVNGLPVTTLGVSGTQSYAVNIEVETDYELYLNAGSNSTTLTNYVTNLTGAVSTIYNRDLRTNVTQRNLHIYTAISDPWTVTTTPASIAELNEIGDYYHFTYGGPLGSGVILLSGKNTSSGIAYEGIVCGGEFPNGADWVGPYAYAGSIGTGALGSVPDPNATTAGTLYGMPANFQTYWPLAEYAHEFGHVMGGHHTHCVAISDAERVAAGFTDGSPAVPTSDFVDHCFASEPGSCFSGTSYVSGSPGISKGTIMSYCHNVFGLGSVPQSRFTFGQAIEPSHHELDDYMLRPAGTLGGFDNIVSAVGTFTISAITAPAAVGISSTGNAASITAIGGATYQWTATNATVTGGATTNAITFTAGPSGTITLRATAFGANGCGVTDTKVVAIGAAVAAPTNVIANATTTTNVSITWTAATGAVSYQVWRATNLGGAFSQIGTPVATSFNDSSVSVNKAYLYKVRTVDAGTNVSADSNTDFATVVIFADDPIIPSSTAIKQQHLTDLRNAVNAMRTTANLSVFAFTDAVAPTLPVRANHINELRTALNAARSGMAAAGISNATPISYTDPTLTIQSTLVKAAHFQQLRNGTK